MRLVTRIALAAALTTLPVVAQAGSTSFFEEHVTGGTLDRTWLPGFGTFRNLEPATLDAANPAFANPSGDHTVGVLTNTVQDSGGVALSCTDPLGNADYIWEGWFFSGAGETRRGLVLRADPTNDFTTCYQFVIQAGLLQMNFRRLDNQSPTTLGSWFTNVLPAGSVPPNTWHKMAVVAYHDQFRCYFDDYELTQGTPIVDPSPTPLLTGWVGTYNFRFDLANVPVYFDDLRLWIDPTPARSTTWGKVKSLYR